MDTLLPYFEREPGTLRRLCKEFVTKHPRLARLVKVPVDRATLEDGKVIEGMTDAKSMTAVLKSSIPFGRHKIEALDG